MMILPPYIPDEEPPDLSKYKKPEKKNDGGFGVGGCLVFLVWLGVVNVVHNQLWGSNIPEDGLLVFLIFDSVVAAVAVGAVVLPILALLWLWRKLTK